MTLRLVHAFALLLGTGFCAVAQEAARPSEVEKLKTKAESMKDYDRGKIYSEIARELTEQASRQFAEGAEDEAFKSVTEVVEFAEKASSAAKLRNKKTKDTEINLRKTARRLEEVSKTLSLQHRPPIEEAMQKVDEIRKELLEYFLKRG